ncbi:UPF0481 protein At3g47200-like [Macadamia integrifolia]|uniref:UPF0481 protein At3g47200-like n=1 Tax=Macadamia integrifolia TaxID=60698 RepID=UPI001C4E3200|nr:UPF0481 protein At3g47200-like [Macadamia integrifolia]
MKEDAYTPDTVSIGPYHRDTNKQNSQMQEMEALKRRYLETVFVRTSEQTSRENYMKALNDLETETRKCYSSDPIINLSSKELVELMLLDGFFIIELLRKNSNDVEFDVDDPIFYSKLKRTRVVRDLVLLENQIPMLVLQKLFDLRKDPNSQSLSLIEMGLLFFEPLIPDGLNKYSSNSANINTTINTHKHLLDLLSCTLESSLPPPVMKEQQQSLTTTPESLPCVTELRHSGVKFNEGSEYGSLMNIKFSREVFEIPQLCVDDYTDSFFRNLIAYEQQRSGGRHCITSYALLMDYLINSADDVAFLRDSGIIKNYLGDDNKVSSLFNNLCSEIFNVADEFYYSDLCDELREYYNRPCNKWKATLMRDYCNSPWTITSVVAAILLLFLTAWGTLFTTLPVFNVNFKHKS